MKISTFTEYGTLKSVIVGSASRMEWPNDDVEFNEAISRSTYPAKFPGGPIDNKVMQEANEDLDILVDTLEKENVKVYRPNITKPHWSYSPRDVLLTAGKHLIECPTPFLTRRKEIELYPFLQDVDCKKSKLTDGPAIFDAANVLKLGDKLLYSISHSANKEGAEWLQESVGSDFEVICWKGVENKITHIDSTVVSIAENTVVLNGPRLKGSALPVFMDDYKKIWVDDLIPRDFHVFPYSSKWIGMNMLSLNPDTLIVDEIQHELIKILEQNKFKVIALPMRQSRTLGGGFHCVTNDLERE